MNEQIQERTLIKWVNCRLAPSDIHGIGVFVIKDIPKGTRLFLDIMPEIFNLTEKKLKNNLPSYICELLLERWPLIKTGSSFVFPDARMVAYMNHSDTPNYDAKVDLALRDLKAGEEVTENYRAIEGAETVYPFLNS